MTAALRAEEPSAKYLSQAAEALARRFELLATAPAGVGRLRTLILTLAVRGKLLPQVFSDEPASGLVAQARSEMDTLAADGLVRAERVSKDVEARDCPYEIPTKWAWVRLATVLPFRIGKTPPTKDLRFWSKNGTRWVSIADMTHRGRVSETQRRVSALADDLFGYPLVPAVRW